jgi:hypothetical protein
MRTWDYYLCSDGNSDGPLTVLLGRNKGCDVNSSEAAPFRDQVIPKEIVLTFEAGRLIVLS